MPRMTCLRKCRLVAPVSMTLPNHGEGAPGPSLLGTGDISTIQEVWL